jgi:hypothetical protein
MVNTLGVNTPKKVPNLIGWDTVFSDITPICSAK